MKTTTTNKISYNKSEIMRNAWSIYRANRTCKEFRLALKAAWREAKANASVAQWAGCKFENGMTLSIESGFETGEYTLSRWTKYGNDRIYINGFGSRNNYYVDLNKRTLCGGSVNEMLENIKTAILSMVY